MDTLKHIIIVFYYMLTTSPDNITFKEILTGIINEKVSFFCIHVLIAEPIATTYFIHYLISQKKIVLEAAINEVFEKVVSNT